MQHPLAGVAVVLVFNSGKIPIDQITVMLYNITVIN